MVKKPKSKPRQHAPITDADVDGERRTLARPDPDAEWRRMWHLMDVLQYLMKELGTAKIKKQRTAQQQRIDEVRQALITLDEAIDQYERNMK